MGFEVAAQIFKVGGQKASKRHQIRAVAKHLQTAIQPLDLADRLQGEGEALSAVHSAPADAACVREEEAQLATLHQLNAFPAHHPLPTRQMCLPSNSSQKHICLVGS